jgi:hypothetical protein
MNYITSLFRSRRGPAVVAASLLLVALSIYLVRARNHKKNGAGF